MGFFSTNKKQQPPTSNSRLVTGGEHAFDAVEAPEKAPPYPRAVFYILATEICERFSYYGMKTVLILYLTTALRYSEDAATVLYHAFAALCYCTPVLGAVLADIWLGRYRTILYLSIVYLVGSATLSLSAVTPAFPALAGQITVAVVGLLLIAVGTGGIKPCVAAFGGDQFPADQPQMVAQFFSIFYFCINLGSLLSTFVSPLLREMQCLGGDCFLATFLLPAGLMAIALTVYVSGSPVYVKVPPSGTILKDTASCLWLGVRGAVRARLGRAPRMSHWLDHSRGVHGDPLVDEVKALTAIMWLFLPLPFFWALFDQQGSRWTLQAAHMDGRLGAYTIAPDQMQLLNPLLILLLVPAFERQVYPALASHGLLTGALQRVTCGGLLASAAFAWAALLQYAMERAEQRDEPALSMLWQVPQYFLITAGEVLFSVSGLQFSFTEAPPSMKSVVQACWLLTISFGNLFVVCVAGWRMTSQVWEFSLFSLLMATNMFIFSLMAHFYTPRRPARAPTPDPEPPAPPVFATVEKPAVEDDPTMYSYREASRGGEEEGEQTVYQRE